MGELTPGEFQKLVDRIYEAAAAPDLWIGVLEDLARHTGCMGGILLAVDERNNVRHVSTDTLVPLMDAFNSGGWMGRNTRAQRLADKRHAGFVLDSDLYTDAEMDFDPLYTEVLRRHGGGWAVGTMMPMTTGDTLIFNIERAHREGPVPRGAVTLLDGLRPHLARAALMSARLQLERARTTVEVFERIGLPAAALHPDGRILAANALIEQLERQFVFAAHGQLKLRHASANSLLQLARTNLLRPTRDAVQSIAVPAVDDHPPLVLHLVPATGQGRDIFGGALVVMIVTRVAPGPVPSIDILNALFDLTPAEARIAGLISSGLSPRQCAVRLGVTEETARTLVKRVFRKTGVSRQSELVALLTRLVIS